MDHTKRAEELAEVEEKHWAFVKRRRSDFYRDAMLLCLPIIERLRNPEHDEDCPSLQEPTWVEMGDTQVPLPRESCSCTRGQARAEADKLV